MKTERGKAVAFWVAAVGVLVIGGAGIAFRHQILGHLWPSKTEVITIEPSIDAVVQTVDLAQRLVVLSVGRQQKVQEGFRFWVYRGDRFVAKVQVVKVYVDSAGARILYTNENETIRPGDKAATQL